MTSSRRDAAQSAKAKTAKRQKPSQRTGERKAPKRSHARAKRVALVIGCIALFAIVVLYPVGRDYYQAMRTEQRLQAQLDAVNARNEAVQAENDALQTEEGIENQAHADLGWVKEGENAAIVTNEQGTADAISRLPDHIDIEGIKAPQTWYYSILDTIFFVHE